jgi:hypothetical protein
MACRQCEQTRRAALYHRYAHLLGTDTFSLLMATVYFAGVRFNERGTVVIFSHLSRYMAIKTPTIDIKAMADSANVTLTFQGTAHQLTVPEDAGFIVQGKKVP